MVFGQEIEMGLLLQQQNKPTLPHFEVRPNDNGTVVASVEVLEAEGFAACIVSGSCVRPCKGATVLDPTQKRTRMSLCCSIRHEFVSAEEAASCKQQQ